MFERYDSMTLNELVEEKDDVLGTIENEKLWMLGARDADECYMHAQNIGGLEYELQYINNLIEERKNANELHT